MAIERPASTWYNSLKMSAISANSLLEGTLESLADGLGVVDQGRRVVYWNARASEFFDIPAMEIVRATEEEFYRLLSSRTVEPAVSLAHLTDAACHPDGMPAVELNVIKPQSRIVEAQWFGLHPGAGGAYGVLFRDITREKELDSMKSQLLSIVSHELRTPLAAIKGFTTTLLREDVRWDEASQREFLRIIDEETDRLGELIDSLLDMSQIETGMLRIEPEAVQLRNLVREAKDRAQRRTESHWFVMDMPAELPRVWADPRRVRQVLNNLLENAIKYSPEGGQITISCEVEPDHVLVSIADQGRGIPPEYREKVFERFFQVDAATTRRTGGSGLGLSIAKGIIEAQGGKIWVDSAPGKGSIFRFTLPLATEANVKNGSA